MATCVICFSDLQGSVIGCTPTCVSCMQAYVVTALQDRKIPLCLCKKGSVHVDVVKYLVKDSPELRKIFDVLCIETTIPVSQRIYCPNPSCGYPHVKTDSVIVCSQCSTNICSGCAKRHDDHHECTKEEESLKEIIDAGFKQCKCGFFVERVMACNKVVCRCTNVFCYKCGVEYVNGRSNCTCPLYDEELRFHVSACNLLEKMKLLPYNNERFKRTVKTFEEKIIEYASRMSDIRAKAWLGQQQKELYSLGRQLVSLESFYHVSKKCDVKIQNMTDHMENFQTISDDMRNAKDNIEKLRAQVVELNRTVAAYKAVGQKRQKLINMVANMSDANLAASEIMIVVGQKKND